MPVFAWWQELKVYFRSARISSPGKQVLPSFCGFCCRGGEEEPLRASRLFFFVFFLPVFYIRCPVFPPLGLSGNFSPTKQVCGLWGVPILIWVPAQDWTATFLLNRSTISFSLTESVNDRDSNRDAWEFFCGCVSVLMPTFVCVCVCVFAHMYGAMPLVLLGLLFVTVIPPNEEVEWVSVLYCSHLQTPYQMPRSLHTSHKHFILIPAHQAKPGQPRSSCHFFVHSSLSVHSLQSEWAPSRPSTKCLLNYLVFFQAKGGV